MTSARQIYLGSRRGPALPYDAEVEWLESTGTQFIELGFGFDPTDEVQAKFSINTSQQSDKYIVAPKTWNNNLNRFGMGVYSGYSIAFGSSSTSFTRLQPVTPNDGNLHQWDYSNRLFRLIDLSLSLNVSSISFGATTSNLKLFYGYDRNTKGRLASYKHLKNSQIMCDLIPVRFTNELGQSEGAMYDRVSGQLFRNAGTGAFTIGPDKS